MQSTTARGRRAIAILLVCGLGLSLRLAGINWGLPEQGRYMPWTADEPSFTSSLYRMDPAKGSFNPGDFKTPSFTTYLLGAVLGASHVIGAVELKPSKDFYVQHPDQRARIFLIGRITTLVFSILSIWLLYILVGRIYPRHPPGLALLAAALLALLPVHVVWSHHLSQHPIGIFWLLLTFYLLTRLMDEQRTRWYVLAGLCAGTAVSTNYSALPLLILIPLAHFLVHRGPLRAGAPRLLLSMLLVFVGFLVFTPYAALDHTFFLEEVGWSINAVNNPAATSLTTRLGHVFGFVLPGSSGWALLVLGLAGMLWVSWRPRAGAGETMLLAWAAIFFFFTLKAGMFAAASRAMPLTVCLPVFAAVLLYELKARGLAKTFGIMTTVVVLNTMIASVLAVSYFMTDNVRSTASSWISKNVPPGSSIGLLREPYWFSPDIVGTDYHVPGPGGALYEYVKYDYDGRMLAEKRADYIVLTTGESSYADRTPKAPREEHFVALLGDSYKRIATFETRAGWEPLFPRSLILAAGLYAPPDIEVFKRRQ